MTREDMASLLAFSYQVYSAKERGERSLFVDRLEALKKTRVNVDYIITGRGDKINETKYELFEARYSLLSEKQKKFELCGHPHSSKTLNIFDNNGCLISLKYSRQSGDLSGKEFSSGTKLTKNVNLIAE